MSEVLTATAAQHHPRPEPAGIVCCSSDLCSQIGTDRLPWARIVVGIFVAAQTMLLGMTINITAPDDPTTLLLLQGGMLAATLVVLALLGIPLAFEAGRQLIARRLTMELLFLAGIAAALAISVWSMFARQGPVYFEVVNALLVVYSIGQTITSRSRARVLSASSLMLNDVATARLDTGQTIDVPSIRPGQLVRVMPGELVPVDGLVVSGQSLVRAAAFTGEWQSAARGPGDSILAGSACEDGTLLIRASTAGSDRRIDQLARLIASACAAGSPLQRLADRFVRAFLPIVGAVAVGSLLFWGLRQDWTTGLFIALSVILVACPCAAGLAVPLATWTAISRLAERGLLLKSADALQRLAGVDAAIFDKTGTLSGERLQVREILTAPDTAQRRRALTLIAEVEQHSEHPVARALRELPHERDPDLHCEVLAVRILPAVGIEAGLLLDGRSAELRLARRPAADLLTIDATLDDIWIMTATFAEQFRESSQQALSQMREMGLEVTIMTGDSSAAGRAASHLAPVTSSMSPEQKHSATRAGSTRTLFIGDGVNDAAAMAASHASIAMASGAAITIEAADATLHGNDLTVIPEAITLARRAIATVRSNFAWAVSYNVAGIALAATGVLHPVFAAVLMSLSSGIVAWRSFHLSGRPAAIRRPSPPPITPALTGPRLPARAYASAHLLGMLGQGALLIPLAQLGLLGSSITLAICLALGLLIIRFARHFPAWLDMTIAMLSIGGLGMNLGWWIDLSFDPAIRDGTVAACCMVRKTVEATTLEANTHWMYWLMLLAGVPAMYLLRRGPIRFNWREWCCTGMLVLGVPGMCFGMWAGAQLAMGLSEFPSQFQVIASYVLMILGMCAGMLVPHALELVRPPKPAGPVRTQTDE